MGRKVKRKMATKTKMNKAEMEAALVAAQELLAKAGISSESGVEDTSTLEVAGMLIKGGNIAIRGDLDPLARILSQIHSAFVQNESGEFWFTPAFHKSESGKILLVKGQDGKLYQSVKGYQFAARLRSGITLNNGWIQVSSNGNGLSVSLGGQWLASRYGSYQMEYDNEYNGKTTKRFSISLPASVVDTIWSASQEAEFINKAQADSVKTVADVA